jgi:hypothetical protein
MTTTADLDHSVAEYFWYICLLGTATSSFSYERFIAIHYKSKLPTYIQETVGDRQEGLQRELNEKNG